MKKLILTIIVLFLLVAVGFVAAKDILAKAFLTKGISSATGLEFQVGAVHVGLLTTRIAIEKLKISNPGNFPDRLMADIPEIYVDCDLGALLKNKVHLKELRIAIKELDIVQDARMRLNVNSLALLLPPPTGAKPPEVQIDKMSLKVGKVSYKNHAIGKGLASAEFNPNIDETFENINDPKKLASQIVMRLLSRIGISDLAKFGTQSLNQITQQGQAIAEESAQKAKAATQELEKNVKDTLGKDVMKVLSPKEGSKNE